MCLKLWLLNGYKYQSNFNNNCKILRYYFNLKILFDLGFFILSTWLGEEHQVK